MAVELLTIKAYKSPNCSSSELVGDFSVQLNPTDYKKKLGKRKVLMLN